MQLCVKNVNDESFRKLKVDAVREKMPLGKVLSLAIDTYLEEKQRRKKPKKNLMDFKGWDWGPGNERVSEEIDKILYEEGW